MGTAAKVKARPALPRAKKMPRTPPIRKAIGKRKAQIVISVKTEDEGSAAKRVPFHPKCELLLLEPYTG